jgi:alpha-tubulin suppressor-like RCC1 family protein
LREDTVKKAVLAAVASTLVFAAPANAQRVYSWGTIAGILKHRTPTVVEGLGPVSLVDASNSSDYALETDGTVKAWGSNRSGTLGDGNTRSSRVPVTVRVPVPVVTLGEARASGAAIDRQGNGWVWGSDIAGDMCEPKTPAILTPEHPAALTDVKAVQGGELHTLWLTDSGHVLTCGTNSFASLGLGEGVEKAESPVEIPGLSDVVEVSAGERQSLARTENGEVYAWGANNHGQTCTGSTAERVWLPTRVPLPERAKEVSGGGDFEENGSSLIVLEDGDVYGCGYNSNGQADPESEEENVTFPENTGLVYAHAVTGGTFSLGLTASGIVEAWGSDAADVLGDGKLGSQQFPVPVDTGVSQISATATNAMDLHG